jgi:hypothetical protein
MTNHNKIVLAGGSGFREWGFQFQFPDIGPALDDLFGRQK